MADIDLSAQFDKISERAKIAAAKVKAARQSTRDQLESDAASARDRDSAAADRLKGKAAAAGDKAPSHWQEMCDKWHAHVATVRAYARERKPRPTPTWPRSTPTWQSLTHWISSISRRPRSMKPSRRCSEPC